LPVFAKETGETKNYNYKRQGKSIKRHKLKMKTQIVYKKLSIVSTIAVIVIVAGVFVGCQQEIFENDINLSPEREMLEIASGYLILNNDQYHLNLSKSEAIKLGISEKFYTDLLNNMMEANAFIESAKKDPNTILVLSDPKKITSKPSRLKKGNENSSMQLRGSITPTTNGAESSISVPNGIEKVKFDFSGTTLLNTASLTVTGGIDKVLAFSHIAFTSSCEKTEKVDYTPSTLKMSSILNSGNGTISIWF